MSGGFHKCEHPLVKHKLTYMRRVPEATKSREYTRLMRELGMLMAFEATQKLETTNRVFVTSTDPKKLLPTIKGRRPVIVPIIRSGLILAEGVRDIIASSFTGHIGIHNEPSRRETAEGPLTYFAAMPDDIGNRTFFIVDPVMISGATAIQAVKVLREIYMVDEKHINFITLVATKQAQKLFEKNFPMVDVYYAAMDGVGENVDIIRDFDMMSHRMYRSS